MSSERISHKSSRGQMVVLLTLALIPMMGLLGLVVDIGYMQYLRKSAQRAADAAVLSAAARFHSTVAGVPSCTDPLYPWVCNASYSCPATLTTASNPIEAACLYARQNGFYPSNPQQNVTLVSDVTPNPPTAPGLNTASWWITARVTQTVPQLFSAVLGNSMGMIAARATAALSPVPACVYALDPASSGSFYQNGSTTFQSGCAIYVDSNNASAMLGNGGAILRATEINIVGGYNWQGTISPPPNTGIAPFPDPMAGEPAPAPCSQSGGCAAAGCPANSRGLTVNNDTTLSPGIYCGGVAVKNATVTFAPGRYILVGGGLSTQDTNSHIRGSGVFFYNTYDSGNAYGPINFNANSDEQLSAMDASSGDFYQGILIMQDRTCCTSMGIESLQGGASSYFEGILYFPTALVQYRGNPLMNMAHYTIVISWQFAVQGTSTMNNDYSHLAGGNPLKRIALVE